MDAHRRHPSMHYAPLTHSLPSTPSAHASAGGAYPFGFVDLDEPLSEKAEESRVEDVRHARRASRHARRSGEFRRSERSHPRGEVSRPGSPAASQHSRSSSVAPRSPAAAIAHSRTPSRSAFHSRPPSRTASRPPSRGAYPHGRPQFAPEVEPLSTHMHTSQKPTLAFRAARLIKPWIPLLAYGATSLGMLIAMAFFKTQVFTGLDHLSHFLQTDGWSGYLVLYSLIVVTTIPPMPLYSTLIVLSGYTFGAIRGLVISYCAALSGAVIVFLVSRFFFRDSISRWFAQFVYLKRVVRAIEKRPKLLFLIRLAPYPYNVMNCLLAASPTLSWQIYTLCTGLSLFKLIIHTTIGSTIHSFADYHLKKSQQAPADPADPSAPAPEPEGEGEHSPLGTISTVVGIVLCVSIFVYLSYVARKAVDDELGDDEDGALPREDSEETLAFLAPREDVDSGPPPPQMAQASFRVPFERHMTEAPMPAPTPTLPSSNNRFDAAGREEANIGLH